MRSGLCAILIAAAQAQAQAQAQSAQAQAQAQAQAAVAQAQAGDSSRARATLDSLLKDHPDADASYWRAQFSATSAERETRLTAFVIDFPFSPLAGTAQYELGMLELTHSDRDRAAIHLAQFLAVSPADSNRTTASLTLARILFDRGEPGRGCAVVLNGRAELPPTAIEIRNQFDFLASPCAGVDTSSAPKPKVDSTAAPVDSAPRSALGEYTIQVAAYDLKTQADRLATRLRGGGFEARVIGTKKPFRVRVGHYSTHGAADAISKKIEALVKLKPFVLLLGPEDR